MSKRNAVVAMLCVFSLLAGSAALAAESAKTYQVTGKILDLDEKKITVEKGKETWEIARDAAAKITGDLQKGAKVTIEYRMVATSVEVKDEKEKKDEKKSEKKEKGKK